VFEKFCCFLFAEDYFVGFFGFAVFVDVVELSENGIARFGLWF